MGSLLRPLKDGSTTAIRSPSLGGAAVAAAASLPLRLLAAPLVCDLQTRQAGAHLTALPRLYSARSLHTQYHIRGRLWLLP